MHQQTPNGPIEAIYRTLLEALIIRHSGECKPQSWYVLLQFIRQFDVISLVLHESIQPTVCSIYSGSIKRSGVCRPQLYCGARSAEFMRVVTSKYITHNFLKYVVYCDLDAA